MKSDNYVVIQGWMCNELNLKGNELLVYALIYGVSQDGKSKFSAGRNYIADTFNISLPTVDKALQNLVDQNLIIKEPCRNQSETDKYFANISSKETLVPKNISSKETLLNNKYISSNTINTQQELFNTNKEVINKEDTYKEKIQEFVDKFNWICVSLPKCVRLTPKRNKAIISILKKFSAAEITEVFNKLEASDFCSGRSGKWRANIDFILVENNFVKTLEGKYDNRTSRCGVETISRGEKRQLSAEEREEIIKHGQKF